MPDTDPVAAAIAKARQLCGCTGCGGFAPAGPIDGGHGPLSCMAASATVERVLGALLHESKGLRS